MAGTSRPEVMAAAGASVQMCASAALVEAGAYWDLPAVSSAALPAAFFQTTPSKPYPGLSCRQQLISSRPSVSRLVLSSTFISTTGMSLIPYSQ